MAAEELLVLAGEVYDDVAVGEVEYTLFGLGGEPFLAIRGNQLAEFGRVGKDCYWG